MREFIAKYEMLWILPLCLIVSLFSVYGLYSFKEHKSEKIEVLMVPLSEVAGNTNPSEPSEVYCASETLIENFLSFKTAQEKYQRVVYDPYYVVEGYVTLDTVCQKASIAFLSEYSGKGYYLSSYLKEGN